MRPSVVLLVGLLLAGCSDGVLSTSHAEAAAMDRDAAPLRDAALADDAQAETALRDAALDSLTASDSASSDRGVDITARDGAQSDAGGTIVWQAGSPTLGHWELSTDGQCGTPVQSGAQFTFNLQKDGTSCLRNQLGPLDSSDMLIRLAEGATYTWTFHYIDGTPSGAPPYMGPDDDARSLIWQIHGYKDPGSPCTTLNFVNGSNGQGGPQMWGFYTCAGLVWTGSYTPGEADDWKIVATISKTSTGHTRLYRNNELVVDVAGKNYEDTSEGNPWFNFGPYKYRWELAAGGGSTMTEVNCTIQDMLLIRN